MDGNTERVVLGAVKVYITEFNAEKLDNLKDICKPENIIGATQGGTTLTYTPEIKKVEDDVGMVRKNFQSKADAEIKTGLLTFDVKSISQMISTGKFTAGEPGGVNRLKLSGGKSALRKFIVATEYLDDETGLGLRVGMAATNTAALELVFNKENETVPNITFSAESNGKDDTIVVIEEDVAPAEGLAAKGGQAVAMMAEEPTEEMTEEPEKAAFDEE